MKTLFQFLSLAAITLFLSSCGGEKDPNAKVVMKVSIGVPESHFEFKAMELFKKHMADNTNVEVQIFPSNQLGSDQEALESMRINTVHMNLPDPAVLGNMVKEYNLLSFPFLFKDQSVANKVVDGEWGKTLLKKLEKIGYVGLGFGDFGFRHITNNVRPITKIEDLKGLKIRTMQNPVHLDVFRTLGANPTPMAFSEVFSSLQQGVIDGQENPLKNIESSKLYEVQKHLTLDGHVYAFVVFVVSKKFFDALSPEDQQHMQKAADIAVQHMRDSVQKEDEQALEILKNAGVQIHTLSDEQKVAMTKMVEEVKVKYAKQINLDFYNELKAAISKAE